MMTETSRARDEAEIRALIEDRAKALRAKDTEGVVIHQTADFLQFSLAPPLISAATDKKGLAGWFATLQGPIGYEIQNLSITAGDGIAFCRSLNRMNGTATHGENFELWFRQTLCLRKVGETWKIAHQHDSVPFYMDGSLKAAVDLQP
jgi:ketosteroid isomerase-like protein